ncbi:MAG: HAD-IIB family hydrolase [Nitrospirae bacterium]|nr:HAD-IIB family hydrolase [Nitrospirota bacterium]
MARIVIFTDLDGTLLHPRTYSFEKAKPALELIKEKKIPLIFCSSKTGAEIEVYRKRLNNMHPFISENGGGIFIPEGYFSETPSPQPSPQRGEGGINLRTPPPLTGGGEGEGEKYTVVILGRPYSEIRNAFIEIRKRLKIKAKGFGDMLTEEIAELAGLPLFEAMLAKARDFDEPFIFEENVSDPPLLKGEIVGLSDKKIEVFLKAIEDADLHWTHGRFYHILGDNDKGKAVKILKGFFEKEHGKITTIGLGDNLNDLPMLKEVDHPILVQRIDRSYEERIMMPNLIKAEGIGPEGWNRAVIGLI